MMFIDIRRGKEANFLLKVTKPPTFLNMWKNGNVSEHLY